jgi:glycosyltransferase involved in cell wall biosynthesis
VVVFGSFFEGWPKSMVEAMAVLSDVTTKVSGASKIVIHGKTGYM